MSIFKTIGELLFGGRETNDDSDFEDRFFEYCDCLEDEDCHLCNDYLYDDDDTWLD